MCFCHFLLVLSVKLSAYPGENIEVSIQTFDELSKAAAAVLRVTDVSSTTAMSWVVSYQYHLCAEKS